MNLKTIADGIATRFANVTATNGTETETASATADLPNTVSKLALLVYPPIGDLGSPAMGQVIDSYDFAVKLLRDPLTMPARSQWLYAWATALRPLAYQGFTLGGIPGVTEARAVEMRVAIDGEKYASPQQTPGGDPFDVVEIIVRVQVFEIATGVAA